MHDSRFTSGWVCDKVWDGVVDWILPYNVHLIDKRRLLKDHGVRAQIVWLYFDNKWRLHLLPKVRVLFIVNPVLDRIFPNFELILSVEHLKEAIIIIDLKFEQCWV